MYCQYCGNQLDKDAVFCSKCGKKIVRVNPVYQQQQVTYQQPQIAYQHPQMACQTSMPSNKMDEKTIVARGMASHYLVSGILLCIFGMINLLFAGLMILAKSYAGVVEELNSEAKAYNFGTLHEQAERRLDYVTGKNGIGPFALNVYSE